LKQTKQGETIPGPDALPDDVVISPDTRRKERLPPNQSRTKKWPVLDAHGAPTISAEDWKLEITGLVRTPLSFDWKTFRALPRVKVFADMHCVTQWSRLGNLWEGVSTRKLVERAGVTEQAHYVVMLGYDHGFTTNLPLEAFLSDDALLTDLHDGEPISLEHGGPVRLIVPQLYAWKSAKWIRKLEFVADDRAGFWEEEGYHMLGDPWKEQRFRAGKPARFDS
jgi:DMSO/TMAO reductase YedYZ molybdopterin-dependent catalytic subunit